MPADESSPGLSVKFSAGPSAARLASGIAAAAASALWFLQSLGLGGAVLFHAAAMLVAWGLLMPLGAVLARYFKVTRAQDFPRQADNIFWWNWHRLLQNSGAALATAGFLAMTGAAGFSLASTHARIGFAVMLIAWAQVLSGLMRGTKGGPSEPEPRGDHYDMTPWRLMFEALHKKAGWIAIAAAPLAVFTGLELAGAGDWAWIAALPPAALLAAVLVFARQRRWVDTHAAIWGPGRKPGEVRRERD